MPRQVHGTRMAASKKSPSDGTRQPPPIHSRRGWKPHPPEAASSQRRANGCVQDKSFGCTHLSLSILLQRGWKPHLPSRQVPKSPSPFGRVSLVARRASPFFQPLEKSQKRLCFRPFRGMRHLAASSSWNANACVQEKPFGCTHLSLFILLQRGWKPHLPSRQVPKSPSPHPPA